ncbi:MAG: protein kinase [Acidobacteria bacterium]|nr:protein kinase [Acidobacteriota bacterium]
MRPERWRQVDEIFSRALEGEAGERARYLDEACGADAGLRAEVEALLAADSEAGDFIAEPATHLAAGALAGRRAAAMPGRRVGHYEIVSRLGAGGMGEVYLARDARNGRRVALKLLPEYFTRDAERVRRFEREARAALALNHPGIVTIYEIGEDAAGARFIASEYIVGETLRERMKRAPLHVGGALDVAIQIASALDAAHGEGVVHRDVKPENVMLRPDGYAKVLDFGIAKLAETDAPTPASTAGEAATTGEVVMTHPGTVLGTARYMSPEQARGLPVDARTDVWSLGVVLYEMVARRPPFRGETQGDLLVALLDRDPPPLPAGSAPPALGALVNKALRKNPADRFQTARGMADALARLKRDLDAQDRAAGDRRDAGATEARGATGASRASTSRVAGAGLVSRVAGRRALALAACALLAAAAAFAAYERFFARAAQINSVAVLPFTNVGGEADTEYLADGVTESIINSLSQASSLKVIARSSVFRYKVRDPQSPAPDPRAVARALNVQAVLTGRVARVGDELLVSAELVNADDERQLWGAQYRRKVADVFSVQEEIAGDISRELRVKLAGGARDGEARRRTDSLKAFEFYTRGRAYIHRRTREDLETAAHFYEQAISEDPNYALAYAGLAEAYGNLGVRGYIPPAEGRRRLAEAANRAVSLDPNLAESHVAVGYSLMGFAPYDFASAERELRRATELSPSLAIAHLYLALTYLREGRLDEGLREMLTARDLDPFSAIIARQVALYYNLRRDPARALQALRRADELGPPFTTTTEADIYVQNRLYDEALARLDQEMRARRDDPLLLYGAGLVYAAQGKRAEALARIKELERLSGTDYAQSEWIAKVYAALGEKEQAFAWLERGLSQNAVGAFYKDEPVWDALRDDPRFAELLRRMGVPA